MKTPSTLQLTALACLNQSPETRKTQYELMIEINQISGLLDTPYSPGTVYPALKSLAKNRLINIDQSGCLVEPAGHHLLAAILLTHPLPSSLTGILHRLLLANVSPDAGIKNAVAKRIDIELIKMSHINNEPDRKTGQHLLLPKSVRQHIVACIRRIALDISS